MDATLLQQTTKPPRFRRAVAILGLVAVAFAAGVAIGNGVNRPGPIATTVEGLPKRRPMSHPPKSEYVCMGQNGVADSWCHTDDNTGTCDDNWGTVWGCTQELDCEGLPACDGLPLPESGSIPCVCTSSGPTPTSAPTPAPPTRLTTTAKPTPAPPPPPPGVGGCCVYTKPSPCRDSSNCVTANGGRFTLQPNSCANDAPNKLDCPAQPAASDACPRMLVEEDAWSYVSSMWGKDGATDEQLKTGMKNAACVWAAVCLGNEECLSRCPVAMGIAGKESLFNPSVVASDGGYGLWQVGGPSAPSSDVGLSKTEAKNPLKLGKWVRQVTNDGEYFSPKWRCWSTCEGKQCNPGAQSSWTSGWVPSWAATRNGGAKAYSEAEATKEACTAAIQSLYPNLKQVSFERRDNCMVGDQIVVDPQR